MECAENIHSITNALEEANDNIRFVNNNYNQEIPEVDINDAIQEYNDNACCDMHKTLYYKLKDDHNLLVLYEDQVATGEWKQHVKWAVIHDSNGNWVDTFGDVPDDVFTDEYLKDKREAEGEN